MLSWPRFMQSVLRRAHGSASTARAPTFRDNHKRHQTTKRPVNYSEYVLELRKVITEIRENPSGFDSATVKIAVHRNGYAFRLQEELREGCLMRECSSGPSGGTSMTPISDSTAVLEVENFFDLKHFYAYSDRMLSADEDVIGIHHWDATVAAVRIAYLRSDSKSIMRQRMVFIGFADEIHSEFALIAEGHLFFREHEEDGVLHEWRCRFDDKTDQFPSFDVAFGWRDERKGEAQCVSS